MKIEICHVGATREKWIRQGEEVYIKKCKRFTPINVKHIKSSKATDANRARLEDSGNILEYLAKSPKAFNILLDERGDSYDSPGFAKFVDNKLMHFGGSLRFITGGPFGVTVELRASCDAVISLSKMVFTHEMIRVILLEQLYRAFSILRGESYHHV